MPALSLQLKDWRESVSEEPRPEGQEGLADQQSGSCNLSVKWGLDGESACFRGPDGGRPKEKMHKMKFACGRRSILNPGKPVLT